MTTTTTDTQLSQLIINELTEAEYAALTPEANQIYFTPDTAVYSVNNETPDANGNVSLAIPTVNDATLTITQGGTTKGTFTANASSDVTINLDAGGGTATDVQINGTSITSSNIANILTNTAYNSSSNKIATMSDLSGFLTNNGTGTNSLALMGTATGNRGVGLGQASEGSGSYSSGLGTGAKATGDYAIQIGYGTNSTASTLSVGFNASSSTNRKNWQLLDGATGLIPDARLSTNIAKTSDIKNSTITITQGGVTKGSFTLNQSSSDTIALDAGGGGTVDQTYDGTSSNAQSGVAISGVISGKADIDLSNINPAQTAKDTIIGWGVPDYSSGIGITVSSLPYEAPSTGLIVGLMSVGSQATGGRGLFVNSNAIYSIPASNWRTFSLPVLKGDILSVGTTTSVSLTATFYPARGT